MSHDVFISHSSKDKTVADAVCSTLENDGIRCWIAPRDIRAGDSWGSSIIKAIEQSRVMVIIFSENANESQQVMREVERAVQKNVVVVPFRIDGVEPTADMEYFLSATHWLDAMTPELDAHLETLTSTVSSILNPDESNAQAPAPKPRSVAPAAYSQPRPAPSKKKSKLVIWIGLAAAAAIAIGFFLLRPAESNEQNSLQPSLVEARPQPSTIQEAVVEETVTDAQAKASEPQPKASEPQPRASNAMESRELAVERPTHAATVEASNPPVTEPKTPPPAQTIAETPTAVAETPTAVSNPDPEKISVQVPTTAAAGSSIEVGWTGPALKGDYLSVAKPSSRAGRQHMRYQYVRAGQIPTLRLPDEPGTYEIRYISGGSDSIRATSPIEVTAPQIVIQDIGEVEAGSHFNLRFTGGGNSGDFLAIFKPGDSISRYSTNKYASRGNTIGLRAPNDAGTYVVRYISGQEKLEWASKEFTVKAKE